MFILQLSLIHVSVDTSVVWRITAVLWSLSSTEFGDSLGFSTAVSNLASMTPSLPSNITHVVVVVVVVVVIVVVVYDNDEIHS